jgi:hypothetical protein
LLIFSGVIFYIIRGYAKIKDSNKSRYNSLVVLFGLVYIDLIVILVLFNVDYVTSYFVETVGIFPASLGIAAIKSRYISVENVVSHKESIKKQTADKFQPLEPVKEIETVYEVVVKRFEFEIDRAKDLDDKASYLIGFVGVIATLFTGFGSSYLTLPPIEELNMHLLLQLSPIISFVAVLIFLFASFVFALKTLQIKEYVYVPNAYNLIGAYATATKQKILQDLTDDYAIAIEENIVMSNKKANSIKKAVLFLFVALFLLLLHVICLLLT